MKSDEQLVVSYRESGQVEALEELVDRHLRKTRTMLCQMVLDPSLADDLAQEVFLRVIRGLSNFDGRAKFSTWLYRVAMNTARSFLAGRRRSPVDFCPDLPERAQTRNPQPECAAMEAELKSAIEDAMGELSPRLRGAVVLTSFQGFGIKEAARIEGCATATMYWRIHEARRKLKKRLARYLS